MPLQVDKPFSRADQFMAEVRAAVDAQGVSRAELARRMGCSKSYVGRLLKGGNNLTIETMEKLVDALDLDFILVVQNRNPTETEESAEPEGDGIADAETGNGAAGLPDLIGDLEIRDLDDAHAVLDTGGRKLRSQVLELLQKAALGSQPSAKPGPKPGSEEDYRPHMVYMALLLESGKTASKREAARWTKAWAETSGHAHASWETLRSRFRKAEEFYRGQARAILARQEREDRDAASKKAAGAGAAPPATSAGPASAFGGVRLGALNELPQSSLQWVDEEVTRIAKRWDLRDETMALIRSPDLLEKVGHLAEMQEIAAVMRPWTPDLTAVEAAKRHVNEAAARLELPTLLPRPLAATDLLDSQDLRAAMSPDLTKGLKMPGDELIEEFKALTRNPLSDLF